MNHRAFFAAWAAGFVVLGLAVKPAAAEDPAKLLARHKAYVGWAYGDGTLRSARLTTVAEAASPAPSPKPGATPDPLGRSMGKTVELRRELLYRSATTAYGLETDSEGFTGGVFWRANENGNTVTTRGRAAREALTYDLIDAEALAEVPSSVRPDAPFDGKTAAVLRLEPKTGAPADVYIDRASGAMLGYVVEPDVPLERTTVHVLAYAEFAAGKRYVAALRYGNSTRVYRVTAFEPNVAISDADLHPPRPRATWTFGEPRGVPITVVQHSPMYGNGGRAVHVDASVNGHAGNFLLDSGAGGVLLFEPFARSAGLADIGRTAYSGVNGKSVGATLVRVDRLQIGGNTLRNLIVQRTSQEDPTIAGIIGYDVLAGAVFDVDLAASKLTIADPAGFDAQLKQGAYAFALDLSDFHAGVPIKVADTILPRVWLDTGDDFFVILPHELERKTIAVDDSMAYFGGVDGSGDEPARCVRLNEIQVGPYRYQKALSCFAPNDTFGLDGGLIGFDFLRHFNWTFDYPHGRVVLSPNGL